MRDGIRVADINGAIGQDGAKESANDALSLVRPPNVAIADVEDDKRVNLRGEGRWRWWCELEDCLLLDRRHSPISIWGKERPRERKEREGVSD